MFKKKEKNESVEVVNSLEFATETIGEEIDSKIKKEAENSIIEAKKMMETFAEEVDEDVDLSSHFIDNGDFKTKDTEIAHSWEKNIVIDGLFLGFRPTVYRGGNPGWLMVFVNRNGEKIVASAGWEVKSFIEEFDVPKYTHMRIEKVGMIQFTGTNGVQQRGQYKISYDPKKVKKQPVLLSAEQMRKAGDLIMEGERAKQKLLPF